MIKFPCLRPGLASAAVKGQGVVLTAETESLFLPDERFTRLIPLLDGALSVAEIKEALKPDIQPVETGVLISQLAGKGLVWDAAEKSEFDAAYWSALNIHPSRARAALSRWNLRIHSFEGTEAPLAFDLLGEHGRLCHGDEPFDVIFTDHYLRRELETWNMRALKEGRPWMLIKASGREIWFGPIFVPGMTGCWECLAQRLRLNRQVESFLRENSLETMQAFPASIQSHFKLGTALAGNALLKWLGTGKSEALGAVLVYDGIRVGQRRHVLVHRPQCAACGDPEAYARTVYTPVRLCSVPKLDKSFTAEESFEQLRHHISPLTGIVKEIFPLRIPQAPFLQVQLALHSQCTRYENFDRLRKSLREVSGGQGACEEEARISALAESVEVYLTNRHGDEPVIQATLEELGEPAIEPESMTLFSRRQQEAGIFPRAWLDQDTVPHRVDPSTPLLWMPVWSLTGDRLRYAPADLLFWETNTSAAVAGFGCLNGTAASWSRETAFLHAFFELIERDAASIWWYNRICRPAVDLSAFSDLFIQETLIQHSKIGRRIWALDLTHDFKIPVFVALSALSFAPFGRPVLGFGCHLDAQWALRKAFKEMNQMMPLAYRPDNVSQKKSGTTNTGERIAVDWFSNANLQNQPWLSPSEEPMKGPAAFLEHKTSDYADDARICLDRAAKLGIEVLMLERTRPDIELFVVKVIAPGVRPWWPRFAPGRLYDVPVSMGWLDQASCEEALNPIPVFI